jgi:hypothetical protein
MYEHNINIIINSEQQLSEDEIIKVIRSHVVQVRKKKSIISFLIYCFLYFLSGLFLCLFVFKENSNFLLYLVFLIQYAIGFIHGVRQ